MSKLRVMVPRKDKARTNLHTSTAGSQGQRCAPSVADSDCLRWKWCCTPALLAVQQPLKFWFLDRSCEHSSRERGFRAKSLKHFVGDYSRVTSTGLDNGLMMGNQNCIGLQSCNWCCTNTPCSTATSMLGVMPRNVPLRE